MTRGRTFIPSGVLVLIGLGIDISGFEQVWVAYALWALALTLLVVAALLNAKQIVGWGLAQIRVSTDNGDHPIAVNSDGVRWVLSDRNRKSPSIRPECQMHEVPLLFQCGDGIRRIQDDDIIDKSRSQSFLCPKVSANSIDGGHQIYFTSHPMTIGEAMLKAEQLLSAKIAQH